MIWGQVQRETCVGHPVSREVLMSRKFKNGEGEVFHLFVKSVSTEQVKATTEREGVGGDGIL